MPEVERTQEPMKSRRFIVSGVAAAATAGSLTFGQKAGAQEKTKQLKVGVLKIAGLANAYAAKRERIFEKNGLDVTLVEFRSGADAITAQQSGAIDIALAIPGTAMTANERGFDFLAVVQN